MTRRKGPSTARSAVGNISSGHLGLLLRLGAIAALAFVFVKIWSEVIEGESHGLDRAILLALRQPGHLDQPIGPGWLRQVMVDLSSLGSVTVFVLLGLMAAGYFATKRAPLRALVLVLAMGGGGGAIMALKSVLGRSRPDVVPHLVDAQAMSFPSGHAASAAIVYLTIAALLCDVEADSRARAYIIATAMTLTTLIGLSRIYLGVHWPSDVAAGWALGAGWALMTAMVMRWIGGKAGRR